MEIKIKTELIENFDLIKELKNIADNGCYEDTWKNLNKFIDKLKNLKTIKLIK